MTVVKQCCWVRSKRETWNKRRHGEKTYSTKEVGWYLPKRHSSLLQHSVSNEWQCECQFQFENFPAAITYSRRLLPSFCWLQWLKVLSIVVIPMSSYHDLVLEFSSFRKWIYGRTQLVVWWFDSSSKDFSGILQSFERSFSTVALVLRPHSLSFFWRARLATTWVEYCHDWTHGKKRKSSRHHFRKIPWDTFEISDSYLTPLCTLLLSHRMRPPHSANNPFITCEKINASIAPILNPSPIIGKKAGSTIHFCS